MEIKNANISFQPEAIAAIKKTISTQRQISQDIVDFLTDEQSVRKALAEPNANKMAFFEILEIAVSAEPVEKSKYISAIINNPVFREQLDSPDFTNEFEEEKKITPIKFIAKTLAYSRKANAETIITCDWLRTKLLSDAAEEIYPAIRSNRNARILLDYPEGIAAIEKLFDQYPTKVRNGRYLLGLLDQAKVKLSASSNGEVDTSGYDGKTIAEWKAEINKTRSCLRTGLYSKLDDLIDNPAKLTAATRVYPQAIFELILEAAKGKTQCLKKICANNIFIAQIDSDVKFNSVEEGKPSSPSAYIAEALKAASKMQNISCFSTIIDNELLRKTLIEKQPDALCEIAWSLKKSNQRLNKLLGHKELKDTITEKLQIKAANGLDNDDAVLQKKIEEHNKNGGLNEPKQVKPPKIVANTMSAAEALKLFR